MEGQQDASPQRRERGSCRLPPPRRELPLVSSGDRAVGSLYNLDVIEAAKSGAAAAAGRAEIQRSAATTAAAAVVVVGQEAPLQHLVGVCMLLLVARAVVNDHSSSIAPEEEARGARRSPSSASIRPLSSPAHGRRSDLLVTTAGLLPTAPPKQQLALRPSPAVLFRRRRRTDAEQVEDCLLPICQ